jgi:hypothetical protein
VGHVIQFNAASIAEFNPKPPPKPSACASDFRQWRENGVVAVGELKLVLGQNPVLGAVAVPDREIIKDEHVVQSRKGKTASKEPEQLKIR